MSLPIHLWEPHEERLVRFLLGDISPEEQAEIEDRVFADRDFLDEVLATGDDLIHAYLTGSLSADDKRRFETHFLASALRRKRFELVRGLVTVARETAARPATPRARPGWWALAAALVLLLGWFGARPWPDRSTGPQVAEQTASPTHAPTVVPTSTIAAAPQEQVLRLPAAATAETDVTLGARTEVLRLVVPVAERRPAFNAVIRAIGGREIWRAERLRASAAESVVVLDVPARLLASAHYTLSLMSDPLRDANAPPPVTAEHHIRVQREP
jgi:hypothetical protein